MTKNAMARVIIQALYNSPTLPSSDNVNVKRTEKQKKEILINHYALASKILSMRDDICN